MNAINKPIIPGQNSNFQRYMWASSVSGFLIFSCGVFNATNPSPLCAILINCILIIYGLIGLRDPKRDFDLLTKYSEAIYFLGYLSTIMVLAGLALEIKVDQNLLDQTGKLIYKGGSAIVSTVIGLFGMFAFRIAAQSMESNVDEIDPINETSKEIQAALLQFTMHSEELLASLKGKSEQIVDQMAYKNEQVVDQMAHKNEQVVAQMANVGAEQASAVGEIFRKMEGLSVNIENFADNMMKISETMKVLETNASGAGAALGEVAAHSTTIRETALELDEISQGLLPAWKEIYGQVSATAKLTPIIENLTQTLEDLQIGISACKTDMATFSEAAQKSERVLLETLRNVENEAAEIGQLSEGVNQFKNAINTITPALNAIAPVITAIRGDLSEIDSLKETVTQLRGNLQNLNASLAISGNAIGTVSDNSRALTENTRNLVAEIANQVHDLMRVTQPMAKLASTMDTIQPQLQTIEGNIKNLDSFAAGISGVKKSLDDLQISANQAASQMKKFENLDTVLKEFEDAVKTVLKMQGGSSSQGRR